ncbi:hypothetical protein ACROYT_G004378 [Oculina patagonica]
MKVLVKPVLLTVTMLIMMVSRVNSLPNKSERDVRDIEAFPRSREAGDRDVTKGKGLSKNDEYGPSVHPCFNATVNHTVTTQEGEEVLCLVPSEKELMKDLEAIGGFNRHYVAVNIEQAGEDFENPFKPIANPNPKPISWSSKFTGRRRRSMDEKKNTFPSEEVHGRVKRAANVGLQTCERTGTQTSVGFYQLCDECWWIRRLPDDRFPRYINEKICGVDGNSDSTFSGQFCSGRSDGFCLQRSFTQDLLVRTNQYVRISSPDPKYSVVYKQVWKQYAQEIRSCCQCQNMSPP